MTFKFSLSRNPTIYCPSSLDSGYNCLKGWRAQILNYAIMSHYYSKVDAGSLLSLVNASDCVEHFGVSSLVPEMDETEVLNQVNEDTIISYLEDKGFKVEKED